MNNRKVMDMLLGVLLVGAMGVSQYFIYRYAPIEETMGEVQKIFYYHLPLAWWALISFFVVFVCSLIYLMKRNLKVDLLAGAAAEMGVLLSGLALITGSIWARAAWNVWWTWDPRLSTTLVMWFVYCGYLVLRGSTMHWEQKSTVAAVVGVVAFLDVPLVFYSARLWRSIHPAVFASKGGGLEPEMWTTVMVSFAAWGVFWCWVVWLRWRQMILQSRMDYVSSRSAEFAEESGV